MMNDAKERVLAYGEWPSPLSAAAVTASSASLGVPSEYGGRLLFTESRPLEAGRIALVVQRTSGEPMDCFGADYSVRTRVHEYGGRAWWGGSRQLYFCNWSDQRLYTARGSLDDVAPPEPITPEPLSHHSLRFADGDETPNGHWVIAVAEVHGEDRKRLGTHGTRGQAEQGSHEPDNVIVAIPSDGRAATDVDALHVLVDGADFMSNPRVSPDGQWLSWVQWQHPNMPWDSTQLMVASLTTGADGSIQISEPRCVDPQAEVSVVGPQWLEDNRLVYSSDQSGWWNLHAFDTNTNTVEALTNLKDAEIGAPAWAIGTTRFAELKSLHSGAASRDSDSPVLVVAVTEQASDYLAVLYRDGSLKPLPLTCASIRGLSSTEDGGFLALVELHDAESQHFHFSAENVQNLTVGTSRSRSGDANHRSIRYSIAESVSFPSGGSQAHGFFYAPCSDRIQGPQDSRPPLIVMGHGGPTAHSTPALRLSIQYWTSRGFAVVDVNYRGSTGFGRVYRQGLNESWGVVDVEDCINAARFLSSSGRVDPARCVIRGGSAGGLTVLRALQLSDVFAAGTSLYGVADLEGLLAETHKFESRYLDGLIGAHPEHLQRYKDRSPIHHAHEINVPLLVLQGDEDKVVPPSQSEAIVAAVAAQGLPHAYVLFAGEQHGWRQAETLIRALELELWFYGAALGFEPADKISAPSEAVGFA